MKENKGGRMAKRTIIFGAFETGERAFQLLGEQYEIIAFADNNVNRQGEKFCGIPVISPERILSLSVELVVITSNNYHVEIAEQLRMLGIGNLKLFQLSAGGKDYLMLDINETDPFRNCIYRKIQLECGDYKIRKSHTYKKKKVLIIAYYFPPAGGSPIQRTLKFVKYLREYGYEPIILTTEINPLLDKYLVDESLLSDVPAGVQIVRIKDDFAYIDVVSKEKAQEIIEFLYSISDSREWMDMLIKVQRTQSRYILPDKLILWANECVRHIEEYVNMQDIDLLYSSVPEWSPHLVAYFLKKKYRIKWVADYRDPWVSNRSYVQLYYPWMAEEEITLDQWLEKRLVEEMDSIILAGGKWAADFVENYKVNPSKIKEITNGYDEQDFINLNLKLRKNGKFTLCYNGGVGYNRNPIPLIKVINDLIEKKELNSEEIQWIFNGTITNGFLKEMEQEDKYHIVVRNGMLPHRESLQIAINSDVMVMYGEFGQNGYLNYPGKFYEYLRIGRPILCFSSKDSFLAQVLQETNLGENMDLYDFDSIEKFLRRQISSWRKKEPLSDCVKDEIRKYERKNLTQMLAEEFTHILME